MCDTTRNSSKRIQDKHTDHSYCSAELNTFSKRFIPSKVTHAQGTGGSMRTTALVDIKTMSSQPLRAKKPLGLIEI